MTQIGKPRIPAGDTFDLIFDVVNDKGEVVIISGIQVRWALADREDSPLPLIEKSVDDGISISNLKPGRLTVTLDHLDTVDLPAKDYWHQVTLNFPGGRVATVHRGFLSILDVV